MLRRRGIKHVVLNAKYHEREAEIVAQAGRTGAVTIATNMAGRGTDILLGGNPEFLARQDLLRDGVEADGEAWAAAWGGTFSHAKSRCAEEHDRVLEAGGLHIVGTERHESRRIDNQLRGRAGRQGDPGSSRFFLSMDDDLMRIFTGDRLKAAMERLGMEEDVPIESPMVSRAIERAQKQVEGRNFEIRKHLIEYDDVNNAQRTEIYALRRAALEGADQREYVLEKGRELLDILIEENMGQFDDPAEWRLDHFGTQLNEFFGTTPEHEGLHLAEMGLAEIGDAVWEKLEALYAAKEEKVGAEMMRRYERGIVLQIIDRAWKDHLLAMDHLKDGIGLRAYGQRDPLVEYKRESFDMFSQMKERIENDVVRFLFQLNPMTEEEQRAEAERRRQEQERVFRAASQSAAGVTARGGVETVKRKDVKVGRNDPCPCGSGKKYKKCHGAA
jgi:preprotein translocase subunit SecA